MKLPRTVRRFLIGYLILHMLAAVIFVIVLSRITRNQMIAATKSKMSAMTLVLAEHIEELDDGFENPGLPAHVKRVGEKSGLRVTLIKSDGSVVVDSVKMDQDIGPHATRQEILSAQNNGTGFSERYSSTIEKPMMYFARRVQSNSESNTGAITGYVRVATPAAAIKASIAAIQRSAWSFAILLGALTALLMSIFSARFMQPLAFFTGAAQTIAV